MKILLVSGNFSPKICGIGDYTNFLAQNLNQMGCETHVLSSGNSNYHIKNWSFLNVFKIFRTLPWKEYDLVHLQYEAFSFSQSYLLILLLKIFKIKYVVTFHEVFYRNFLEKLRNKFLIHHSIAMIVNDAQSLAKIQSYTNKPVDKLWVSSNIPKPTNKNYSSNEKFQIGYFGFINAVKRMDVLLEAFLGVLSVNKNVQLCLIGALDRNSKGFNDILTFINNNNLSQAILIYENKTAQEVSNLLNACDLIVLPYLDGATTRRGSLMAAFGLGKAIITTKPTVIDKDIFSEKTVEILDSFNDQSLAGLILKIMTDSNYKRLLETNSKRIGNLLTWERLAAEHIKIYSRLN